MSKSDIKKFNGHTNRLTFVFENWEAANCFKHWLCESGEQGYWQWQEYAEAEEAGDITGIDFDYHTDSDEIIVKCGRLTDER